jgi:hypothetical protein
MAAGRIGNIFTTHHPSRTGRAVVGEADGVVVEADGGQAWNQGGFRQQTTGFAWLAAGYIIRDQNPLRKGGGL